MQQFIASFVGAFALKLNPLLGRGMPVLSVRGRCHFDVSLRHNYRIKTVLRVAETYALKTARKRRVNGHQMNVIRLILDERGLMRETSGLIFTEPPYIMPQNGSSFIRRLLLQFPMQVSNDALLTA
jgi:hypothetical protein